MALYKHELLRNISKISAQMMNYVLHHKINMDYGNPYHVSKRADIIELIARHMANYYTTKDTIYLIEACVVISMVHLSHDKCRTHPKD